jgi:hypothetical protein
LTSFSCSAQVIPQPGLSDALYRSFTLGGYHVVQCFAMRAMPPIMSTAPGTRR